MRAVMQGIQLVNPRHATLATSHTARNTCADPPPPAHRLDSWVKPHPLSFESKRTPLPLLQGNGLEGVGFLQTSRSMRSMHSSRCGTRVGTAPCLALP